MSQRRRRIKGKGTFLYLPRTAYKGRNISGGRPRQEASSITSEERKKEKRERRGGVKEASLLHGNRKKTFHPFCLKKKKKRRGEGLFADEKKGELVPALGKRIKRGGEKRDRFCFLENHRMGGTKKDPAFNIGEGRSLPT